MVEMTPVSATGGRIAWLDQARAIGITLVVVGHAVRAVDRTGLAADAGVTGLIDTAIYSFHMPFFFVLAGLTHGLSARKGWRDTLAALGWTILLPYLLWSTIWIGLKTLFAGAANVDLEPDQILKILVEPVDQFWFLYVLLIVRAAFLIVDAIGSPLLSRLAIYGPLVVAFAGIGGGDGLLSGWLLFWAAFYGLGVLVGQGDLAALGPRPRLVAALAAAAAWAGGIALVPDLFAHSFGPIRTPIAVAGCLALLLAVSALPAPTTLPGRLIGFIGEASLAIFLTHTIVGAAIRVVLARVGLLDAPTLVVAATIAGIVLPAVGFWLVLAVGARMGWPLARWLGLGGARRSAYLPIAVRGQAPTQTDPALPRHPNR